MAVLLLALLAAAVPAQNPSTLTTEEAIEAFEDLAKDEDNTEVVAAGISDLTKRYDESLARSATAQAALEAEQGSASDHKKVLKEEEDVREDIADALETVFRFRKKPTDWNMRLWRDVVVAWGGMGEFGADHLWDVFDEDVCDDHPAFASRVVEEIGRTRDYTQWEELVDLLDHHEIEVVVGAAKALAFYAKAPGKVRYEVTEKLVRALESYHSKANDGNITGPRRFGQVNGPLNRALRVLTGANHSTSLDWVLFWNEAKKDKELWRDPDED